MIIRILGEGQYSIAEDELRELNQLDEAVEAAAESGNQETLTNSLTSLLNHIRSAGEFIPNDEIVKSDLILPEANATVEQIRQLLDETDAYPGLVPN